MEHAMTKGELAIEIAKIILAAGRALLDSNEGRITPDEALMRARLAAKGPSDLDARVDAHAAKKFPRTVADALEEDLP
jgi:hypothetical protein